MSDKADSSISKAHAKDEAAKLEKLAASGDKKAVYDEASKYLANIDAADVKQTWADLTAQLTADGKTGVNGAKQVLPDLILEGFGADHKANLSATVYTQDVLADAANSNSDHLTGVLATTLQQQGLFNDLDLRDVPYHPDWSMNLDGKFGTEAIDKWFSDESQSSFNTATGAQIATDANGNVTKIEASDGSTLTFIYAPGTKKLIEWTDDKGNQHVLDKDNTWYTYDQSGNLTSYGGTASECSLTPDGTFVWQERRSMGVSDNQTNYTFEVHETGDATIINDNGFLGTHKLDGSSVVLSESGRVEQGDDGRTLVYDTAGRITHIDYPSVPGGSADLKYDDQGNITELKTKDINGNIIDYNKDNNFLSSHNGWFFANGQNWIYKFDIDQTNGTITAEMGDGSKTSIVIDGSVTKTLKDGVVEIYGNDGVIKEIDNANVRAFYENGQVAKIQSKTDGSYWAWADKDQVAKAQTDANHPQAWETDTNAGWVHFGADGKIMPMDSEPHHFANLDGYNFAASGNPFETMNGFTFKYTTSGGSDGGYYQYNKDGTATQKLHAGSFDKIVTSSSDSSFPAGIYTYSDAGTLQQLRTESGAIMKFDAQGANATEVDLPDGTKLTPLSGNRWHRVDGNDNTLPDVVSMNVVNYPLELTTDNGTEKHNLDGSWSLISKDGKTTANYDSKGQVTEVDVLGPPQRTILVHRDNQGIASVTEKAADGSETTIVQRDARNSNNYLMYGLDGTQLASDVPLVGQPTISSTGEIIFTQQNSAFAIEADGTRTYGGMDGQIIHRPNGTTEFHHAGGNWELVQQDQSTIKYDSDNNVIEVDLPGSANGRRLIHEGKSWTLYEADGKTPVKDNRSAIMTFDGELTTSSQIANGAIKTIYEVGQNTPQDVKIDSSGVVSKDGLCIQANKNGSSEITTADGTIQSFDKDGKLIALSDVVAGRNLNIAWDKDGLPIITTAAGTLWNPGDQQPPQSVQVDKSGTLIIETLSPDKHNVEGLDKYYADGHVEHIKATHNSNGSIVYRNDGHPPVVTDVIAADGTKFHYNYKAGSQEVSSVERRAGTAGDGTPIVQEKAGDAALYMDGSLYAENWPGLTGKIDTTAVKVDLDGNLTLIHDKAFRAAVGINGSTPADLPVQTTYQTNGSVVKSINGFVTEIDYRDGSKATFERDKYDQDSISKYTYSYVDNNGVSQSLIYERSISSPTYYLMGHPEIEIYALHVDLAGTTSIEQHKGATDLGTTVTSTDGWSKKFDVSGKLTSEQFTNGTTLGQTTIGGQNAWKLPNGQVAVLQSDGNWHEKEFEHGQWNDSGAVYSNIATTADGRLLLSETTGSQQEIHVIGLDGKETVIVSPSYLSNDALQQKVNQLHDHLRDDGAVMQVLDGMTLADRMKLDALYMKTFGKHITNEFGGDGGLKAEVELYRLDDQKADFEGSMRLALAMLNNQSESKNANFALQTVMSEMTRDEWNKLSNDIPHLADLIQQNANVSQATKDALTVFLAGSDSNMVMPTQAEIDYAKMQGWPQPQGHWKDDVALKLVDIAIKNGDINMFEIAMQNASQQVRQLMLNSGSYHDRLLQTFSDGDENKVVKDFMTYGQISLITLTDGNRSFGYYNKSAVTADMLNAPIEQRQMYALGYELSLHPDQIQTDAQQKAYQFYQGLSKSLDDTAWTFLDHEPWSADRWKAELMFGGNNVICNLVNAKDGTNGAQSDSNAKMTVLENMSKDDWEKYQNNEVFRNLFNQTLRDVFTDPALYQEASSILARKEKLYNAASNVATLQTQVMSLFQGLTKVLGLDNIKPVDAFDYQDKNGKRNPLELIADGASISDLSARIASLTPTELTLLQQNGQISTDMGYGDNSAGRRFKDALVADIMSTYPAASAQSEALLAAVDRLASGQNDALTSLLLDAAQGKSNHVLLNDLDKVLTNPDLRAQLTNPVSDSDKAVTADLDSLYWLDKSIFKLDHVPLFLKLAADTDIKDKFQDILHASDADLKNFQIPNDFSDEQRQLLQRILSNHQPVLSNGLVIGYTDGYARDKDGNIIVRPVDALRLAIISGGSGLTDITNIMSQYSNDVLGREALVNQYATTYQHDLKTDVLKLVGDKPADQLNYSQLIDAVTITDPREYVLRTLDSIFSTDSGLATYMLGDSTKLAMYGSFHDMAAKALAGMDADQVKQLYEQTMNLVEEMSKSKKGVTENINMIVTTVAGLIAAAIPGGQIFAAESLTEVSMILARAFVFGAVMKVGMDSTMLGKEYDFSSSGSEDILMGGIGFMLNFVGPQVFEKALAAVGFGTQVADAVLGKLGIDSATSAGQFAEQEIGTAVRNAALTGGHLAPDTVTKLVSELAEKGINISATDLRTFMTQEMTAQFGKLLPVLMEKSSALMIGTGAGGMTAGIDVAFFHLDSTKDIVKQLTDAVENGMKSGFIGAVAFTAAFSIGGNLVGVIRGQNGTTEGTFQDQITVRRADNTIIEVTPGEKFEFQPGDRIVKVGNTDTTGLLASLSNVTPIDANGSGTASMKDGRIEVTLGDKTYGFIDGKWKLQSGSEWLIPDEGVPEKKLNDIATADGFGLDVQTPNGTGTEKHVTTGVTVAKSGDVVYASQDAVVRAYPGATVYAEKGAIVYAEGGKVIAESGAEVYAYEGSEVTAGSGVKVFAGEQSKVTASDGSTVIAAPGSTITAQSGARVFAYENSNVVANSGSTVFKLMGANVQANDGANVQTLYLSLRAGGSPAVEAKVMQALSLLPDETLSYLSQKYVRIDIADNILSVRPDLANKPVPGQPGVSWGDLQAAHLGNGQIVITGDVSTSVVFEEIAHAIDFKAGNYSNTDAFLKPYNTDVDAILQSPEKVQRYKYQLIHDSNGAVLNTSGNAEAFAEATIVVLKQQQHIELTPFEQDFANDFKNTVEAARAELQDIGVSSKQPEGTNTSPDVTSPKPSQPDTNATANATKTVSMGELNGEEMAAYSALDRFNDNLNARAVVQAKGDYVAGPGEVVFAMKGSTVVAKAGAIVIAEDGAIVFAQKNSWVQALEGSNVTAEYGSKVSTLGAAQVYADRGSKILAGPSSKIIAEDGSNVVALDGSTVEAYGDARVIAAKNASVTTDGSAKVIRLNLNFRDSSAPYVNVAVMESLTMVPDEILSFCQARGLTITTSSNLLDLYPGLKGTPPGYPEGTTYADIPAVHILGTDQIAFFKTGSMDAAMEEIGHFVDAQLGMLSRDRRFEVAYYKEIGALGNKELEMFQYQMATYDSKGRLLNSHGRTETFAKCFIIAEKEALGVSLTSSEVEFKKAFKDTYSIVETELTETGLLPGTKPIPGKDWASTKPVDPSVSDSQPDVQPAAVVPSNLEPLDTIASIATKYGDTEVSRDLLAAQKITNVKSIELTDKQELTGSDTDHATPDQITKINFADGSYLERVDETTWRRYSKDTDTISIEKLQLASDQSNGLELIPVEQESRLYADGVTEIRTADGKVTYENLNLSNERTSISDAIHRSDLSTFEKSRFDQLMKTAENRIQDPAELAKTYHEIMKLFLSDAEIPKPSYADRIWLAEQIMMNIADPSLIAQGKRNPTCTVASLEKRIATLHPADYARLIAEAGIGEPYITKDGRVFDGGLFNVQDLDVESRLARINRAKSNFVDNADLKADNAARNWASQIFQNFAANLDPEGGSMILSTKASWIWRGDSITGGNFVLKNGQWIPAVSDMGFAITSPFVGVNGISSIEGIYEAITGVEIKSSVEPELAVTGTTLITRMKREQLPDRAAALEEIVKEAQAAGNLPLLVTVDTRNEPLWTDSDHGKAGGAGGWHAMVITGIDPSTGKIYLQNNWGTLKDYVGDRALTPQQVVSIMKLQ